MINIPIEEIRSKMFFIREEDSDYPIAVVKVGDLMNFSRLHGEWNYIQAGMAVCPFCGASPHKDYKNFCPNCGADMKRR